MRELIGYCGLDCEKCDSYIATVNDDEELRTKTAKLWSEYNNAPITPDMINCLGCRCDGVKTPYCESMCSVRICVLDKGIAHCGQCSEMESCEHLKEIAANTPEVLDNLKL